MIRQNPCPWPNWFNLIIEYKFKYWGFHSCDTVALSLTTACLFQDRVLAYIILKIIFHEHRVAVFSLVGCCVTNLHQPCSHWGWSHFHPVVHCHDYTPRSTKLKQGILVSPFLSVDKNRVRFVSSTILTRSISYLHTLSSNIRRCAAYKVFFFKIKKFSIVWWVINAS